MGHWNYRVLFDGQEFWVGEVYYDDSGVPFAHTGPDDSYVTGETFNELVSATRLVGRATFKPVLEVRGNNYVEQRK